MRFVQLSQTIGWETDNFAFPAVYTNSKAERDTVSILPIAGADEDFIRVWKASDPRATDADPYPLDDAYVFYRLTISSERENQ